MISYDDFSKIELKIGKVLTAERIEGSEKLLKLEVDFVSEKRQIVSGIAKAYTPEQIINKNLVFITNLEPRSIMGLESNGMLLAAEGPVVLVPDREVIAGSVIK